MKLNKIVLKNFFNHANTVINLEEIESPILVQGKNGSGKTSAFVEPITFAIFGQTRHDSADKAIRVGEEEMSVEIDFELNGQIITIIRSKKRDKTQKLELYIDDNKVDELLTETQKRINKMFGLSYDSFRSSIILRQDDANFFVKSKPDERKKIIAEILDLSQYEYLEEIAKKKRVELKAEIKAEKIRYDSIEEVDIPELETNIIRAEKFIIKTETKIKEAEKLLNELVEWNSALEQQIKFRQNIVSKNNEVEIAIKRAKTQIDTKNSELKEIKEFIKSHEEPTAILNKLKKELVNLEESYKLAEIKDKEDTINCRLTAKKERKAVDTLLEKVQEEKYLIDSKINDISSKIKKLSNLKDAECPTCLRTLSTIEKNKMLEDLKQEGTSHLPRHEELKQEIIKLQNTIEAIENYETPELKRLYAQSIVSLDKAQEISESIKKTRKLYEEQLNSQKNFELASKHLQLLEKSIDESKHNLKTLEEQIQEVPEIKLQLKPTTEAKETLSILRNDYNKLIAYKAEAEKELKDAHKSIKEKEALKQKLTEQVHKLNLVEKLCMAFSRKGIPANIIETVLPEIQDTTNQFLETMSDGQFQMSFITAERLKNGEEKDTLEIQVYDGKAWHDFDALSGGEQFRVSLSLRLALSKVLTRRAGIELELLILDEPAVALDADGRETFCTTIKSLTNIFSRIIVMSHLPQLVDEFDNRINLSKSDNGSKVV